MHLFNHDFINLENSSEAKFAMNGFLKRDLAARSSIHFSFL